MKIKFSDIIAFFKIKGISYEIKGKPKNVYIISSIFYPVKNGFYFLEGDKFSSQLKNSLILTCREIETDASNTLLIIQESPQYLFYKLLDYYYGEKSIGKICDSAKIHKEAIIGKNVQIDSFVVLGKCKIGDNTIIKSHTVVNDNVFVGKNTIIEPGCIIGATGMAWIWDHEGERIRQPQLGGVLIEDNCTIGAQSVLVRGSLNENTIIGANTVIAPGARIGHGTQIGKYVHLANNIILAGNTNIGERSFLGSGCIVSSNIKLPKNTVVGAGALVNKNFNDEFLTLIGVPAKVLLTKNYEQKSKGVPKPFKSK
jgi:UDP-3-O-[3-hydroxymyristoyl] glucosamine N-acyltransferase